MITMTSDPRPAAKWAALIDDRLVPLPRRLLPASVILQQAGASEHMALVRDFSSPDDFGFDPDATVDLAEGNVFRTSSVCERRRTVTASAPAKLAFVVDDAWEVTVQPIQSGHSLRGLLGVRSSRVLLRDFESPIDEPIEDHEQLKFRDGPVFITRPGKPHDVTIIVEGTPHQWHAPEITYAQVVTLFDPHYPQHPEINYSARFKNGPACKPEGVLPPGASIKVKDHMVFYVCATAQS